MRPLWLVLWRFALAIALHCAAHGQGTVVFNNLGSTDGKVFVFYGFPGVPPGTRALLNEDINFDLELLAADGSTALVVRSWLLSNGTANGINVGPGLFADPSHSVVPISGTQPGETRSFAVGAWVGDYPTLGAAEIAGVAVCRGSPFTITLGTLQAPAGSLVGMRDLSVGIIPEPSTISLAILGALLLSCGGNRSGARRP